MLTPVDWGLGLTLAIQFGTTVWWASGVNTTLKNMTETMDKLTQAFSKHVDEDHVFHAQTIRVLSRVATKLGISDE